MFLIVVCEVNGGSFPRDFPAAAATRRRVRPRGLFVPTVSQKCGSDIAPNVAKRRPTTWWEASGTQLTKLPHVRAGLFGGKPQAAPGRGAVAHCLGRSNVNVLQERRVRLLLSVRMGGRGDHRWQFRPADTSLAMPLFGTAEVWHVRRHVDCSCGDQGEVIFCGGIYCAQLLPIHRRHATCASTPLLDLNELPPRLNAYGSGFADTGSAAPGLEAEVECRQTRGEARTPPTCRKGSSPRRPFALPPFSNSWPLIP